MIPRSRPPIRKQSDYLPCGPPAMVRVRRDRLMSCSYHSQPDITLVLNLRRLRVHLRAEVTKADERLGGRCVLERHAGLGRRLGAEDLVLGQLMKSDQLGAVEAELVHAAFALHGDEAVRAVV